MNKEICLVLVTSGSQGAIDKSHIPLGLLYIGSSLKQAGYSVRILHLLPDEIEAAMRSVAASTPLWCGFSVLSGSTTYWAAVASERLKELAPAIPIVWGGHHATIQAEECLSESYVDIIVRAEGEITSVELSQALESRSSLLGVEGVSYKDALGIHHNASRALIEDLDSLPLDFSLINLEDYFRIRGNLRNVSFFSSRGCPFNCAFCSTPMYSGKAYRTHSADYVMEHLDGLARSHGVDSVYFSDDNFYLDKARAKSILQRMHKSNIKCHTLDVRLDQLTEDDLVFFKEYDVSGIFFGWESGSDRLLKLARKRLTTDMILAKAEMIGRHDIICWGSSIILLPTEQYEETLATISMSAKLRRILRNSTVGVFRYSPLPKTDFTELAIREGFRQPTNQKDWRKVDPLEPTYRAEWIPWYTDEIGAKLRCAQEMSRWGIAGYRPRGLKYLPFNMLAASVNRRFLTLNFDNMWERPVYSALIKAYDWYKGHGSGMRSTILDGEP